MESFNGRIIDGFLTQEECEEIIFIAERMSPWDNANSAFWDNKVLNDVTIYNKVSKELGDFLFNVRDRIAEEIRKAYGLEDAIYSDVQQIVRWNPGMQMSPHSDNMENTEAHEHHKHRAFGVVIYLNENYDGGETYYPQHKMSIFPKTGRLAIHPSDTDHMHGVGLVGGQNRYTLVSFWTFDESKKQDISSYI